MKNLIKQILLISIFSFTIASCSRVQEEVRPPAPTVTIPALAKAGVYQLDGTSLFNVELRMKKSNTNYLFENREDPYQGKMVSVSIDGVPVLNEIKNITIGVQNLNIPSGKMEVKVEKITEEYLQLVSSEYRFVIPKK